MSNVFTIGGINRHSEIAAKKALRRQIFDHMDSLLTFHLHEDLHSSMQSDEATVAGMRHRQIVDDVTRLFEVEVIFLFPGNPKPKDIIENPIYRSWAYGFLSGWVWDNGKDLGDQVRNGIVRAAPMLEFKHGVMLYHGARIQMGSVLEKHQHSEDELKKSTVLWGAYVSEGIDLQDGINTSIPHIDV